jgi:predicted Zn-dependent protease
VSDAGTVPARRFREIRVFGFRDRVDLVRILAHELGHALGLAHTEDAGAVMSAEQDRADLSGRPVALQPSDRRALEAMCSTPGAAPATR